MSFNINNKVDSSQNINLFDELFYRDLNTMSPFSPKIKNIDEIHNTGSKDDTLLEIDYELNYHGYRSKPFDGKAKLITLGCSQTFGSGMIDEFTWSYILAEKLNVNFARLALQGDSIQAQIVKTFQYFKEFGHPEIIVGTFPLFRMELPYIENKFESQRLKKQNSALRMQQVFLDSSEYPKYSKSPYDPNEIIPQEISIFYSFIFISILEQYCDSNNILFLWNIYEDNNKSIYNFIKNNKLNNHILKNYVQKKSNGRDVFGGDYDFPEKCHQEYSSHILFKHAADLNKHNSAHWGIHKHIHIAEAFYEAIQARLLGN